MLTVMKGKMRSEIGLAHGFRVVSNHLSSHIYALKIRENYYNALTSDVRKHSAFWK